MALHHILYANRLRQEQTAKHYPIEVINNKLENGDFNPLGETYSYKKIGKTFRCGKFEREDFKATSLTENLNVTNSGLVLYTTDFRIVDNGVRRGDKIIYNGNEYSVFDFSKPSNHANKQFQRKSLNGVLLISLT